MIFFPCPLFLLLGRFLCFDFGDFCINFRDTICNNMVNDCFRRLPPSAIKVVSLNGAIEGTGIEAGDAYTYEDIIADTTYDPAHVFSEKETVKELTQELKDKQARERREKKEAVLREVTLLSKRPAEVLCRLSCTHLGIKARDLAARIIQDGYETTFAKVILEAAKCSGIKVSEIQNIIAGHKLEAKSIKADTNSEKQIAGQISRLVYNANKHLRK